MPDLTLQEAAEKAGMSYPAMKKAEQRGQIRSTRTDGRIMVSEEDLEAFTAGKVLVTAGESLQMAQPAHEAINDLGKHLIRLPARVQVAILAGISEGSPKPYLEATAQKARKVPTHADPHWAHPVGFVQPNAPRWKRESKSTWVLGKAQVSWNGISWVGAGSLDGQDFDLPMSPAHELADLRPKGK